MSSNDTENAALIIVDVQKAFEAPPEVVEGIRDYARKFKTRVYTRFVNPPDSLFRRKLDRHSCAPGSEDLEFVIQPEPGDLVIDKDGYGLKADDIARLKAAGIRRAIVCGIDTDACVLGVMFSLFDHGITCHAKQDLCASSSGLHDAGMAIIREQFPEPR